MTGAIERFAPLGADLYGEHASSRSGNPRRERPDTARELWTAGASVYADVLEGSYAHQPGIGFTQIHDLHQMHANKLDVHLMVDDPIRACQRLPSGLGRLTIQISRDRDLADIITTARSKAKSLWLAVDGEYDLSDVNNLAAHLEAMTDTGNLVMLTPPGQPGKRASPDRIQEVRKLHQTIPLPLGADGDVNAENLDEIIAAGASPKMR